MSADSTPRPWSIADAHGDPPWPATEYIPGPSLHDVLRQQGALPTRTLHTLAVGVADALKRTHACDIIHRDLRPSNTIISSTGPRVIDFGIARALDSTALTRTNHVVGTQGFLAPKRLTGASITHATDLYAFGMVLCHAARARPLTDGESLETALSRLPSRFVGIITRCLNHDPDIRPAAAEVLEQLSPNDSSPEDWLLSPPVQPLRIRAAVIFHGARHAGAGSHHRCGPSRNPATCAGYGCGGDRSRPDHTCPFCRASTPEVRPSSWPVFLEPDRPTTTVCPSRRRPLTRPGGRRRSPCSRSDGIPRASGTAPRSRRHLWWSAATPTQTAREFNAMLRDPEMRAIIAHDGGQTVVDPRLQRQLAAASGALRAHGLARRPESSTRRC
ncbi:protein kinase [Streptomyces sp. NPDC004232]|uniref:protein kinase domain-containing protein n=1 Tax=Streptomyces sp. NPDC004232 TaxID=3154454 RepID=UPI0033B0531E